MKNWGRQREEPAKNSRGGRGHGAGLDGFFWGYLSQILRGFLLGGDAVRIREHGRKKERNLFYCERRIYFWIEID